MLHNDDMLTDIEFATITFKLIVGSIWFYDEIGVVKGFYILSIKDTLG